MNWKNVEKVLYSKIRREGLPVKYIKENNKLKSKRSTIEKS